MASAHSPQLELTARPVHASTQALGPRLQATIGRSAGGRQRGAVSGQLAAVERGHLRACRDAVRGRHLSPRALLRRVVSQQSADVRCAHVRAELIDRSVKFLTKMFHPNVYSNGELCLDILQNRWSPTYDVAAILTSIQSLLHDPNPARCACALSSVAHRAVPRTPRRRNCTART